MRRDYLEDELPGRADRFLDATPEPVFPPDVAQAIADHPWEGQYGLFLYGPPGTGKTVAARLLARRHKLRFVTERGIVAAFRESIEPKVYERSEAGLLQFFRYYATRIVIDDLGGGDGGALTPFEVNIVARVLDVIYQASGTPVVTSNKGLREVGETLGMRTASRLKETCRIVPYKGDDRRLRRQDVGTTKQPEGGPRAGS